jgi:hypothetical protein
VLVARAHVCTVRGELALFHLVAHVEARELEAHADLRAPRRVVLVLGLFRDVRLRAGGVARAVVVELLALDVAETKELVLLCVCARGTRRRSVGVGECKHIIVVAGRGGGCACAGLARAHHALALVAGIGLVALGADAPATSWRVLKLGIDSIREASRILVGLDEARLLGRALSTLGARLGCALVGWSWRHQWAQDGEGGVQDAKAVKHIWASPASASPV